MQGHFKHLCFKNFLIMSWGPNLVFVYLSNQGSKHLQLLHKCNSQSGSALGSHWASSLHSPPFVRVCFTPKHIIDLMGLCTSHLVVNNVRVATSSSYITLCFPFILLIFCTFTLLMFLLMVNISSSSSHENTIQENEKGLVENEKTMWTKASLSCHYEKSCPWKPHCYATHSPIQLL